MLPSPSPVLWASDSEALPLSPPSPLLTEMSSVPPENRSFAIALNTLCIHALGDVPSPVVVGNLLDTMAPACAALMQDSQETEEGDFIVSDGCKAQVSSR